MAVLIVIIIHVSIGFPYSPQPYKLLNIRYKLDTPNDLAHLSNHSKVRIPTNA